MDDEIYIGNRHSFDAERLFGLLERDLAQHLWIIGRSGSGKSTLLRNLAVQHLAAGRGLGVLDPHGDLADALLQEIPPGRMDQVVVFDPADLSIRVGLNLLAQVPRDERPLVASGIVSVFRHLWAESWGPRSEYILTNAIAALLDCPPSVGATLLGVPRLFVDDAYRALVVRHVENAKVRSFWLDEFERWDARFRAEAVAPLQNKAGALLTNPMLRNVLGQVKRRFDPAVTLERGQVLIANLAKGKLGEAESGLLGALLVTALYLAALGRARQAPGERRPFHLIIDEFQSFSTDSLASILAEARKYGLSLTLAHQKNRRLQ